MTRRDGVYKHREVQLWRVWADGNCVGTFADRDDAHAAYHRHHDHCIIDDGVYEWEQEAA